MPPKTTSEGKVASLSERDHQAVVAAFKCNKNAFEIDFDAYATTLGLANAASGRTNWHNLKKKLGISGDTKATDTPKKRKAAEAENGEAGGEDDDEEEVVKSPKKKTKAGKTVKKGKAEEAENDEGEGAGSDDDEEVAKTPKKTKAGKAAKKGKKGAAPAVKDEDEDDI